jgi:hypothetical protein
MHRLAILFVFTAACGGAVSQIEMRGKDPDLAAIAGDWLGQYQGQDTGRSGAIQFSLQLGRHTADGEVLLAPGAPPLRVTFVAVKHASVSGQMERYTDPTCKCEVETQFDGTVDGNEIGGTYTTKAVATGTEMHGTWRVARAGT